MRSDFTYHTREANGTSVLVIIDLDQGGMSVTNNVEKEAGMSYYWICEACGASLDPGEKCDCSRENQKTPEPAKTKGEGKCKKTA